MDLELFVCWVVLQTSLIFIKQFWLSTFRTRGRSILPCPRLKLGCARDSLWQMKGWPNWQVSLLGRIRRKHGCHALFPTLVPMEELSPKSVRSRASTKQSWLDIWARKNFLFCLTQRYWVSLLPHANPTHSEQYYCLFRSLLLVLKGESDSHYALISITHFPHSQPRLRLMYTSSCLGR